MNNLGKKYKETIDHLQKVETLIEEYQQFAGKLMNGATGICLALRVDKQKTAESYLEKEKAQYDESPARQLFGGMFVVSCGDKETKTITSTFQEIDERTAINICRLILENLMTERVRLLQTLGMSINQISN